MNVGTEWVIDAAGCAAESLRDATAIGRVLDRAVSELGLRVVGEAQWNVFPGEGGVTAMLLLSESHLTCHTFPEHGVATFNLYCCRERPTWPWADRLREMLGASHVVVRTIERGVTAPEPAQRRPAPLWVESAGQ
jgi:S-adenosylmethionine decarboxylase